MEYKKFTVEQLREEARNAGVKDTRMGEAPQPNHVPEKGTIEGVILTEGQFAHIRLGFKDGSISQSRSYGDAFFGKPEDAKFRAGKKDPNQRFLVTSRLNTWLPADGAQFASLVGRQFEATKKIGLTLPYKEGGYTDEEEARKSLVPIDCWVIKPTN